MTRLLIEGRIDIRDYLQWAKQSADIWSLPYLWMLKLLRNQENRFITIFTPFPIRIIESDRTILFYYHSVIRNESSVNIQQFHNHEFLFSQMLRKIIALSVHLFTALGVVLAFWSLLLIIRGEVQSSLVVLAIAALIDSVDGTFARRAKVKTHFPQIDGALLDNIVDYLTWTFLPIVWAYFFLDIPFWIGSLVLLSSLYGFSHTQAKTDGNFFQGFPSYWNLTILYLYVLEAEPLVSSAILLILAIFVLIPLKFVYPSQVQKWKKRTLILFVPYGFMLGAMLFYMDETPLYIALLSFYYPVYYVVISMILSRSEKFSDN